MRQVFGESPHGRLAVCGKNTTPRSLRISWYGWWSDVDKGLTEDEIAFDAEESIEAASDFVGT